MNRVLNVLLTIVCLGGIVAATLAFGEHYNTNPSPCQINSIWDCGIVNHSHYAVLHGIPVAMIGVVGYALLIAFAGRFPWLTFIGAVAGFAFSLRFTYVEWKVLQVWCLYCVSSQTMITLAMLLALAAALTAPSGRNRRRSLA